MPSSQQILEGLTAIANNWRGLAVGWHLVLGVAAAACVAGWRPERRLAGWMLATPAASVSTLAWLAGNPFNGAVFSILTVLLVGVAFGLSRSPVRIAGHWVAPAGAVLFVFGWVYPHFLQATSWVEYLYAAPFGLLPCPTLSGIAGIGLIFGGLGSRAWSLVVSAAGVIYGLIGWFRLGVQLDAVLLVGALVLGVVTVMGPRTGVVGAETGRKVA